MDIEKTAWVLACLYAVALSGCSATEGPGMTVTFNSAIKDTDVTIKTVRLPNGTALPGGGLGGKGKPNQNPLNGGGTMGAAPDGRQLPEYIDFEWRESPVPPPDPTPMDGASQAHNDWSKKMMAEFYTHPMKSQRVPIRSRVPAEVIDAVIEANHHSVSGQVSDASIEVYFIWTEYGIKFRWHIWHTPAFNRQYYSDEGGDELVPSGTTMIAGYSNAIKDDKYTVDPASPGKPPRREPASASGLLFSGGQAFAFTDKPTSGGEKLVAFESEQQLPEWVDFNWRLFPISIPRKTGESDADYQTRRLPIFSAVPIKYERVPVRSRIPQDVQNEIAVATRNAQPHKVADSLIYLYFVWTETGIKLHWRLKRSQPDGSFISVREGGDELAKNASR